MKIDIPSLLHDYCQDLAARVPDAIVFEPHIQIDEAICELDADHFIEALKSLKDNAVQAMPEGGRLKLDAKLCYLDEGYVLLSPDVRPGHYVCISIADDGVGMDSETVARIFEPFFTTKEVQAGVGLGMSMVYGFMTQLGGYVHAYSEKGIGTTIKLYLPLVGNTAMKPDVGVEVDMHRLRGKSVMIIDDNEMMCDIAAQNFERLGMRSLIMTSAAQAEGYAQNTEEAVPDFLFVDVFLDNQAVGTDLVQSIGRANPAYVKLPVLYASGYAQDMLPDHIQLGDGAFIHKPYGVKELSQALALVLK